MRKHIVFFLVTGFWFAVACEGIGFAAQNDTNDPTTQQARADYHAYLEQLKALSKQYQYVTGEVKKVIQEEGVPVFDENTGNIVMKHDLTDDTTPDFQKTDVEDHGRDLAVNLEMPGLKKDSLKVKVQNNKFLSISGRRKSDNRTVERAVELPGFVEENGAKAKYEDGILTVTLRKSGLSGKEVHVPVD